MIGEADRSISGGTQPPDVLPEIPAAVRGGPRRSRPRAGSADSGRPLAKCPPVKRKRAMTKPGDLRSVLRAHLAEACPGIEIRDGLRERWNRPVIEFRWDGFAGLLPEERFRLIMGSLPEGFYEEQMRGCVCVELAPGEDMEAYLALPRSEDVTADEPGIARRLIRVGFFAELEAALGGSPLDACSGSLQHTRRLLRSLGFAKRQVERACLVFIGHRSFCDCEVLGRARRVLSAAGATAGVPPPNELGGSSSAAGADTAAGATAAAKRPKP